ncbi:hypothetical protein C0992_004631 [Termitomyces sp. T32_za158]|nr:hypothetical protein C0992_004631 [Termitomyces sp. T32_za158]
MADMDVRNPAAIQRHRMQMLVGDKRTSFNGDEPKTPFDHPVRKTDSVGEVDSIFWEKFYDSLSRRVPCTKDERPPWSIESLIMGA